MELAMASTAGLRSPCSSVLGSTTTTLMDDDAAGFAVGPVGSVGFGRVLPGNMGFGGAASDDDDTNNDSASATRQQCDIDTDVGADGGHLTSGATPVTRARRRMRHR